MQEGDTLTDPCPKCEGESYRECRTVLSVSQAAGACAQ